MALPDVCPLCGRPIDPAIRQLQGPPDAFVTRRLRAENSGWHPDQGACPDCIYRAASQARASTEGQDVQAMLGLPFPADDPDLAILTPTPQRVPVNAQYTGRGVTVAFLDSGFYPHPDLVRPTNRIVAYTDATAPAPSERPSFGKIQATSWHGLMVSAIGIGNGWMSEGRYRGIAPRARAVLVKTGNRRSRSITERDIGRALKWVIAQRATYDIKIVNISLGGDHVSTGRLTELDERVEEATAAGLLVVAAGGNSGSRGMLPPASAPSALTVGGLDDRNSLSPTNWRLYWSSYGAGAHGVAKPDVIAPAIWLAAPMLPKTTTHHDALFLFKLLALPDTELCEALQLPHALKRLGRRVADLAPDDARRLIRARMVEHKYIHPHYQHVDGTSMAAPIVSAIAAQMLEANPALTPAQLKALITATATPLPEAPLERQGAGIVNGARAVAAALRLAALHDGAPRSPQRSITFHYYDRDAKQVAVVGTFNNWLPYGYELDPYAPGAWRLTVPAFAHGRHAYKFLIDRTRWTADPENPDRLPDGTDGFFSLLEI
jgi:serine protease AprX